MFILEMNDFLSDTSLNQMMAQGLAYKLCSPSILGLSRLISLSFFGSKPVNQFPVSDVTQMAEVEDSVCRVVGFASGRQTEIRMRYLLLIFPVAIFSFLKHRRQRARHVAERCSNLSLHRVK